jgi:hypothetical protein
MEILKIPADWITKPDSNHISLPVSPFVEWSKVPQGDPNNPFQVQELQTEVFKDPDSYGARGLCSACGQEALEERADWMAVRTDGRPWAMCSAHVKEWTRYVRVAGTWG